MSTNGMSFNPLGGFLNMLDPAGVGVKGFFQQKVATPALPAIPTAPSTSTASTTVTPTIAAGQGYSSTIQTSGLGDTSAAATAKKQLLGG